MHSYLLPVTINSRKIILLDLAPVLKSAPPVQQAPAPDLDTYIIKIPTANKEKLFTIAKSKIIQSLVEGNPDLNIKDLAVTLNYSNDKNQHLELSFSESVQDLPMSQLVELSAGLSLLFEVDLKNITASLMKDPSFKQPEKNSLTVSFKLDLKNDLYFFNGNVLFYIANHNAVRFAGLDFGSEASQMREARFGRLNPEKVTDTSINLFEIIRKNETKNPPDNQYTQFEESSHFFKSVFFSDKDLQTGDANDFFSSSGLFNIRGNLHIVTLQSELQRLITEKHQVPNLKIIHGNPDFANQLIFTITDPGKKEVSQNLSMLKDSIYSGLLYKMIDAYLRNHINEPVYLHFTLLVPNIYTIQEIVQVRQIVRSIIQESETGKNLIQGIEVSCLSESDASFMGCLNQISVKQGEYYIIIDCGKGTTDFSIIQADWENKKTLKPVYRNGFAGAGNLITYSLLQSVISFLQSLESSNEIYQRNLNNFLNTYLNNASGSNFRHLLFQRIEEWKKNFNPADPREDIEKLWLETKQGANNLTGWFSMQSSPSTDNIMELFNKIPIAYDWNGHVERTLADMTSQVSVYFEKIIQKLNQKGRCGGLLLTGRGFHFQPLRHAMLNSIRKIKKLENIKILNDNDTDLKGVCMKGIFYPSIITHADVSSTPFEIKKGTLRQISRADIRQTGMFTGLKRFGDKLYTMFFPTDQSENYNEDANELKVLNTDIDECQFFSSGKLYQVQKAEPIHMKSGKIIQSRHGLHLRITDTNEKEEILTLSELDSQNTSADKLNVLRSLFPGIIDQHDLLNKK